MIGWYYQLLVAQCTTTVELSRFSNTFLVLQFTNESSLKLLRHSTSIKLSLILIVCFLYSLELFCCVYPKFAKMCCFFGLICLSFIRFWLRILPWGCRVFFSAFQFWLFLWYLASFSILFKFIIINELSIKLPKQNHKKHKKQH